MAGTRLRVGVAGRKAGAGTPGPRAGAGALGRRAGVGAPGWSTGVGTPGRRTDGAGAFTSRGVAVGVAGLLAARAIERRSTTTQPAGGTIAGRSRAGSWSSQTARGAILGAVVVVGVVGAVDRVVICAVGCEAGATTAGAEGFGDADSDVLSDAGIEGGMSETTSPPALGRSSTRHVTM